MKISAKVAVLVWVRQQASTPQNGRAPMAVCVWMEISPQTLHQKQSVIRKGQITTGYMEVHKLALTTGR